MFLRSKARKKDGKKHRYWSVVESRRVASGRVVQRHVFVFGGDQRPPPGRLVPLHRSLDEDQGAATQMALFPEDRPAPELACAVVQVKPLLEDIGKHPNRGEVDDPIEFFPRQEAHALHRLLLNDDPTDRRTEGERPGRLSGFLQRLQLIIRDVPIAQPGQFGRFHLQGASMFLFVVGPVCLVALRDKDVFALSSN
nr:hypothetical protein [uncultured Thiodictyon sp.]